MKKINLLAFVGTVLLSLTLFTPVTHAGPSHQRTTMVEVFTSANCPYCPRMEKFLGKLQQKNPLPKNTVILSWHVTYMGDEKFASKTSDQRQKQYAKKANFKKIGTPQIRINNETKKAGWIPSDPSEFMKIVSRNSQKEPAFGINLQPDIEGTDITANVNVKALKKTDANPENLVVRVVLFQIRTILKKRGKGNRVKKLPQHFAVRNVSSPTPLKDVINQTSFSWNTRLPDDGNQPGNFGLAVLIENKKTLNTLGSKWTRLAK